jgi:D-arabinose 1-dehydrogenase-like Zn-dependent alcohol dehydrogenase
MISGPEGVGVVLKVGPEVRMLQKGDRVGWGYQHNSCGICRERFRGEETACNAGQGYGDVNSNQGAFGTMAVRREAFLLRIPDYLTDVYAAPLMCAGSAVFSALVNSGLPAGARVGVLGMGRLGHLAIQFAAKQGMKVTVLSQTKAKRSDALELGASGFHVFETISELRQSEAFDLLLITSSHHLGNVASW